MQNSLNSRGIGEAERMDLGCSRCLRWATSDAGTSGLQGLLPLRAAVVNGEGDTGGQEVGRHRLAQGPKTDEANRNVWSHGLPASGRIATLRPSCC